MQTTVAVIGGGGHVGLGLSLLLADTGHTVVGIDTNVVNNARIMAGDSHGRQLLRRPATA
ncbi:MAG: hypothetical protein H7338_19250 [Candidatus Sericytochromatia bacterium]|nr:hypothetical protein [Candidatus Sericytochromatia bacterium]